MVRWIYGINKENISKEISKTDKQNLKVACVCMHAHTISGFRYRPFDDGTSQLGNSYSVPLFHIVKVVTHRDRN